MRKIPHPYQHFFRGCAKHGYVKLLDTMMSNSFVVNGSLYISLSTHTKFSSYELLEISMHESHAFYLAAVNNKMDALKFLHEKGLWSDSAYIASWYMRHSEVCDFLEEIKKNMPIINTNKKNLYF